MEIKTCEEYVLGELSKRDDEIIELKQQLEETTKMLNTSQDNLVKAKQTINSYEKLIELCNFEYVDKEKNYIHARLFVSKDPTDKDEVGQTFKQINNILNINIKDFEESN
jgi:hypothetical protein